MFIASCLGHLIARRVRALAFVLLALLPLAGLATPAAAQCGGRWLTSPESLPPGPEGETVFDLVALPNGDLIAGGLFTTSSGRATAYVARWNGTAWAPMGAGFNGLVSALAVMPNGDVIACGRFTASGTTQVNRIARWDGSTWSPLGSGLDNEAYALTVLPSGHIVVGGFFTAAGGQPANRVALWDGATWSPLGSGVGVDGQYVSTLAHLPSGDVIAGGPFTTAGSVTVNNIARWDGSAWHPLGDGFNSEVTTLTVLPSGDLLAGGRFTSSGATAANRIARWDGAQWSPLGAGLNNAAFAMKLLPSGDLVVGGSFTAAGSTQARFVARWNGAEWSPLGDMIRGTVSALATLPTGELIAGGVLRQFREVTFSITGSNVARWNGSTWLPLGFGVSGSVHDADVLPNGHVVAVGAFNFAGGVQVNRVARWDGTEWSPLGSGLIGPDPLGLSAVKATPTGDVLVAGRMTGPDGSAISGVARWNSSQNTWTVLGSGFTGSVSALAVLPSGDIIAAGSFTAAGGTPASNIARWDGAAWQALGAGVTFNPFGISRTLAVLPNGDVVAAGRANPVTSAAQGVVRWNGANWSPVGAGIGLPTGLTVAPNGDLLAFGANLLVGSPLPARLARWNGTEWSAIGAVTGSITPARPTGVVVLPGGDILASGAFNLSGSGQPTGIIRWNGTAWSQFSQGAGSTQPEAWSDLLLLPSGEVVVGETMGPLNNSFSTFFSRWTPTGIPWVARQPTPASAPATRTATLSAFCASGYDFNGPVTFQWQRNGVNIADGPGGASPGGGSVSGAAGALSAANLGATLTISGVQPSDAGEYTVVFTNACGSVTSAPATLTITPAPCSLADVASVGGVAPPDGLLTGDDFNAFIAAFIAAFVAGEALADITGIGGPPALPDGLITGDDFNAFIGAFAQGCP